MIAVCQHLIKATCIYLCGHNQWQLELLLRHIAVFQRLNPPKPTYSTEGQGSMCYLLLGSTMHCESTVWKTEHVLAGPCFCSSVPVACAGLVRSVRGEQSRLSDEWLVSLHNLSLRNASSPSGPDSLTLLYLCFSTQMGCGIVKWLT